MKYFNLLQLIFVFQLGAAEDLKFLMNSFFAASKRGEVDGFKSCYLSQDKFDSVYGYSVYSADISLKLYREYLKNGLSDGAAVFEKARIDKDDAKRIGVTEVFPFEYNELGVIKVVSEKDLSEKKFLDGMVVSFNWTLNNKIRQAALVTSALVKEGEAWKFVGKFSNPFVAQPSIFLSKISRSVKR